MVVDAEEPDPRLLAEGEADRAAELDELRLAEVCMQPGPERVELLVRARPPRDRLCVRERRLLPVVVAIGRLEVEQIVVLRLLERTARLLRTLVPAVLALDGA